MTDTLKKIGAWWTGIPKDQFNYIAEEGTHPEQIEQNLILGNQGYVSGPNLLGETFTIISKLGEGGFGCAIKCRRKSHPNELYAVKVFKLKDAVSEPDPRTRHEINLKLVRDAKEEYRLHDKCARKSQFVAKVYALAHN